jgi:hypothetical protein
LPGRAWFKDNGLRSYEFNPVNTVSQKMKAMNQMIQRMGRLLGGGLLLAVAGCTTYVQEAPVGTVYDAPAPPPPPIEQPAPVVVPPPAPAAEVAVEIRAESDFYEPLSPLGEWIVVGTYGRCWRPLHVDANWRPYSDGHWQRTEAGWYWVTDEPWGWATYHYGRWDLAGGIGWVWVPQTQWAPSWVAWREGGGYIGWAPLPPHATIAVSGGVTFRDASFAPHAFVFVEERRMLEPMRPATLIVNNTAIINKTVNITKIQVVNKTVVNEGPRPDAIERVSGRKIQTLAVRDLRHRDEAAVAVGRVNSRQPASRQIERPAPEVRSPAPQPAKGVMPMATAPRTPVQNPVQRPLPPQPVAPNRDVPLRRAGDAPARPVQAEPQKRPATVPVVRASNPPAVQNPQAHAQALPAYRQVEKPVKSPKQRAADREAAHGRLSPPQNAKGDGASKAQGAADRSNDPDK